MAAPVHSSDAIAVASASPVRNPSEAEFDALLGWLDDGQRDGVRGALSREYPTALVPPERANHFVAVADERFASHAYIRVVDVIAGDRRLALGMIGLVYTDPSFRRRGLARLCIEACVERLDRLGVPVAALWSDRRAFYGRLGFEPAGREIQYVVTPPNCAEARRRLPGPYRVATAESADFAAAETLHDAKPVHAERAPGDLARLASVPDCRVVVARSGRDVVAYAACGRGADFAGVVHEWAGEPGGVAACLEELVRDRDAIGWLTGPLEEAPVATLRASGALAAPGCFALCRILDVEQLVESCAVASGNSGIRLVAASNGAERGEFARLTTAAGEVALDHAETLELLFGAGSFRRFRERGLDSRRAPRPPTAAPDLAFPIFVSGFDSV